MEKKLLIDLTDQELEVELKKRKNERFFAGFLIGILVGIAFWSATHKGTFLPFAILALVIYIAKKYPNVDEVTTEVNARKKSWKQTKNYQN